MNQPKWISYPGLQTEYLQRKEFEILFGGVPGGGMTDLILIAMAKKVGESGNEK